MRGMKSRLGLGMLLALTVAVTARAEDKGTDSYPGDPAHKVIHTATSWVEYPEIHIDGVDARIKQWIADNVLESDATLCDKGENCQEHSPATRERAWKTLCTYAITRPSDRACSIVFIVARYPESDAEAGREADVETVTALNFNAEGKLLTPADIFYEPDKTLPIFANLTPQLIENKYLSAMPLPDGVSMHEKGMASSWENFGNFAMVRGAVRIYFATGQLLPANYGPLFVDIPLFELRDARINDKIWIDAHVPSPQTLPPSIR